jgi:malonyl-CoA O-methyltransferase
MSSPAAQPLRPLDVAAVRRAVRRLAAAGTPPWLHGEVARRMAERLALIKLAPQRVLEWSGFLGASGDLLARACPQAQRVVVDPDAALLERSRRAAHAPWWSVRRRRGGVSLVVGDDDPALAAAPAQLIWSNMLLHAEADPPALFARWERLLAADGFVMFSCLGPGTLPELRALYAARGWGSATQDFVDMHDLGDMLVHAGLADPVMDQETLTLTWPDAAAALAELRSLGGNVSPLRFAGLRTPRWRARFEAALTGLAGADGQVRLRFEVVYGHAFKAAPRLRSDRPTTVSLEDMRTMARARRPAR